MKERYQMMEKVKNNLERILSVVAILLMTVSWVVMCERSKTPQNITKTDTVTVTDTMWKDTTITQKEIKEKKIKIIKRDTVYTQGGDTLQLTTEAKTFEKSIVSGKDTADVQIFTTGINTSLDSLKLRLKTHTVTNTIEITKVVEKKKTFWDRFHIGIQSGYGYAFKSKEFSPYVGIGGSFDL